MSEILYKYVKGKGWVPETTPNTHKRWSALFGPHLVTVIDTPPRTGERGWMVTSYVRNGILDLVECWHAVTAGYRHDQDDRLGWICTLGDEELIAEEGNSQRYITVEVIPHHTAR